MNSDQIFNDLWNVYSKVNPSVSQIHKLFESLNETIINDHIAFRTFNDPRISIDVLSKEFIKGGYKEAGEYVFPAKKLYAKHFENPADPLAPRVFISELQLEKFPGTFREKINNIINAIPKERLQSEALILDGEIFGIPEHGLYEELRKESEYAAWLYAFGFRANHFTVSVNHLKSLNSIEEVNDLLKSGGYSLNTSGGEVKGSREQLLKQSSTLADIIDFKFKEGIKPIPSCYYEFAERFKDKNGKIFSGFIAESADKIFESTDYRNKNKT